MKRLGGRRVWSVREVTAAIARRFDEVPSLWVEAEVQNLRRGGGQVYFTLRDDHQIDASMNGVVFERLDAAPRDGGLVHAYGRVEFWAERSQIRMRVERLELAGEGMLLARIAALRAVLQREGLLDDARKRPLPLLPRRVGVITSATGAARDDVLRNLWERDPQADVVFHDVPVQGDAAAPAIVAALRRLAAIPEVDVVIVTRGGGALEDLMAFNSEDVCRAVAASRAPVVSAVGHERDVTLCDLVADLRVSTPTAAARAVVPDTAELAARLAVTDRRLTRGLTHARDVADHHLQMRTAARAAGLRATGRRGEQRLERTAARLGPALARHVEDAERATRDRADRMRRGGAVLLARATAHLDATVAMLDVLAPARTVARGYAIVTGDDGRPVVSVAALRPGAAVRLELRDGRADATITHTQP